MSAHRRPCGNIEGAYLAGWRLGEPQSPLVHQGMFDSEVLRVMEDSDGLAVEGGAEVIAVGTHGAVWGDWDGVEGNRLRGDSGHDVGRRDLEWFAECGLGTKVRVLCTGQKRASGMEELLRCEMEVDVGEKEETLLENNNQGEWVATSAVLLFCCSDVCSLLLCARISEFLLEALGGSA